MVHKSRLPKPPPKIAVLQSQRIETVRAGQWRDKRNDGSTARGYGYAWQKAREQFLLEHPLCELECREHDRVTPSTVVDHSIPHRGDPVLFWKKEHWRAACKTCHDSFAQKRDREQG